MADAATAWIMYMSQRVDFFAGGYHCAIPIRDIAIDADGAPDAYGPPRNADDKDGSGTDSLTSAGYPTNEDDPIADDWHDILVSDPADRDRPLLKPDGHYISKTSLCDETLADASPGKFIDANRVPYVVMPQFWIDHLGVMLGDLCLIGRPDGKGRIVAIVGDLCPADEPLGELSIAAASLIGGENVSPRNGVDFPIGHFVELFVFKGTRPVLEWPLENRFIQSFKHRLETRLEPALAPGARARSRRSD